jgi:hypothetical protein
MVSAYKRFKALRWNVCRIPLLEELHHPTINVVSVILSGLMLMVNGFVVLNVINGPAKIAFK